MVSDIVIQRKGECHTWRVETSIHIPRRDILEDETVFDRNIHKGKRKEEWHSLSAVHAPAQRVHAKTAR